MSPGLQRCKVYVGFTCKSKTDEGLIARLQGRHTNSDFVHVCIAFPMCGSFTAVVSGDREGVVFDPWDQVKFESSNRDKIWYRINVTQAQWDEMLVAARRLANSGISYDYGAWASVLLERIIPFSSCFSSIFLSPDKTTCVRLVWQILATGQIVDDISMYPLNSITLGFLYESLGKRLAGTADEDETDELGLTSLSYTHLDSRGIDLSKSGRRIPRPGTVYRMDPEVVHRLSQARPNVIARDPRRLQIIDLY